MGVAEQEDRADEGAGREDRVLERAEPEYPHARLIARNAEILERLEVDRESAARSEHPEAGRDDRAGPQSAEPDAAADVGDLAVRECVADVRGQGSGNCEGNPVPVRVPDV